MSSNLQNLINIESNKTLRSQLSIVCQQIEDTINNHKTKREINNILLESNNNTSKIDIQKINEFKSQIDEYKKKIESAENILTTNIKFIQIKSLEDEISHKMKTLVSSKKEYETLMKIKKNQDIALKEIDNGVSDTIESQLIENQQKLKNLKEELKILLEFNKNLTNKIKIQDKEINGLNDRCKLVKDNIELKKKGTESGTPGREFRRTEIRISTEKNIFKKCRKKLQKRN